MEDERLRQIRELIANPGFPTSAITRDRVSSAMRQDMLGDGQLDPRAAAEMRRKLADQLFMEMRLRGAAEFGPFRTPATGAPEDTQYKDADRMAAMALQNERGSVANALAERERQPAAPDYADERMRQAMEIGLPANKDDMEGRIQEEADALFLQGKMDGHPIDYKDADLFARDRMLRYQQELQSTSSGPVAGEDRRFSEPVVVVQDYPLGQRQPQWGTIDPRVKSPGKEDVVVPRPQTDEYNLMRGDPVAQKSSADPKAAPSPRRFITAPRATPIDPPADSTTRPTTLGEMDAVSEAAARALAKRRAKRRE